MTQFILYWPENTGHGTYSKCGLYTSLKKNNIFICKWLSIRDSFLVKGKTLCLLLSLSFGIPSSLNLSRPCICEVIDVSVLLWPEGLFSLVGWIPFDSFNLSISSFTYFPEYTFT